MSKSREQKLLDAALLIQEHCKELRSKGRCDKCIFDMKGWGCHLNPSADWEPYEWGLPETVAKLKEMRVI